MRQLTKKAARGYRGHPLATIAFYGPTDQLATKVAVGMVEKEDGEIARMERWIVERGDVRSAVVVEMEVVQLLLQCGVRSVVMTKGIIGCPHEEGVDYPEGKACPQCPFWEGRDRWAGAEVE